MSTLTMKSKLQKDISASTIQVVLNQFLGLIVFFITSRYLSKEIYGELNWSLAILTFSTTIMSLRLEQIVVRKIASGEDASHTLTSFTFHIFSTGIFFYLLLIVGNYFFPSFFSKHTLLLMLAISQLIAFFSMPFKQVANGKEKFGQLAIMSSVSNLFRSIFLVFTVVFFTLSIQTLLYIFILSSLVELFTSIYIVIVVLKIRLYKNWKITAYLKMIKQSLPQIGTVFLNACIARADWILLGIFSTPLQTAEYSFAYKVFELSPVPMIILAPLLLSKFSAYFSQKTEYDLLLKPERIDLMIRFQMIMATSLPLLLNILWAPLIDMLTNNKYGAVNQLNFFLLSCCIPFQYLINFFWTVNFAQNRLKKIFFITAVSCFIIVCGNLLLIPKLNALGSAIVYLLAMATEFILLLSITSLRHLIVTWGALLICMLSALTAGFISFYLITSLPMKLIVSGGIYSFLMIIFRQIRKEDIPQIKEILTGRGKKNEL